MTTQAPMPVALYCRPVLGNALAADAQEAALRDALAGRSVEVLVHRENGAPGQPVLWQLVAAAARGEVRQVAVADLRVLSPSPHVQVAVMQALMEVGAEVVTLRSIRSAARAMEAAR